jgi:hypothetical protein
MLTFENEKMIILVTGGTGLFGKAIEAVVGEGTRRYDFNERFTSI